ncbi:MAG TPA: tyrosinase family protein [Thermoleophilaceae bacterium]|nr:tyrosinase family protein [Thermoleophilaceae bacterium]
MTRTRDDVWNLTREEGDWPAALVAYERAVALLRELDPATGPPSNPRGWRFLAAMHGLVAPDGGPDRSNELWSNCQHGSWYFLPWHRMYLMAFELVVQDVLEDDEWSLPYWYAVDPDDEEKAILPPAFREQGSNLHTDQRSFPANAGLPLPDLSQTVIDALGAEVFSTPAGISTFGGGERATPSFNGGEIGLLEGVPHGAVHSLVGNDYDQAGNPVRFGWMGSFYTAALDPIFWLHHANIDRLWQVWLDLSPANLNPTGDPAWADTQFSFPSADGDLHTWKISEVLDPESLGYVYASTAPPSAVAPPVAPPVAGGPDVGFGEVPVPEPLPPQVIGTTVDVPLATSEPVEVELSEPADLGFALDAEAEPAGAGRVFLRVEGVTGTAAAPVYDVYINLPPGEAPAEHLELRAGSLSTFGMTEASQSDDVHDGSGLTTVLDVTSVRDVLEQEGRWDPARVQVSFHPVTPAATPEEVEAADATPADLRAGQISVVVT